MNKTIFFLMIGLSLSAHANLGGPGYDRYYNSGNYTCNDPKTGMTFDGGFNKDSGTVSFTNRAEIEVNCGAYNETAMKELRRQGYQTRSVCEGVYNAKDKTTMVVALTNSMGSIQALAFRVKGDTILAKAVLNCQAAAKKSNSGWD